MQLAKKFDPSFPDIHLQLEEMNEKRGIECKRNPATLSYISYIDSLSCY